MNTIFDYSEKNRVKIDFKGKILDKFNINNLKKVVNEYKPDIVHAHDLKAIILASFLNKKYGYCGII